MNGSASWFAAAGFALLVATAYAQTPPSTPGQPQSAPATGPSIVLPEGTVLASGHVLGGLTTIQPIPGPAEVRFEDGSTQIWEVEVDGGETKVFGPTGALIAKAEFVARERDGKPSCFIYQVHIAPEWLGMPQQDSPGGKPDISTVDDKVYSFRDGVCP